MRFPARTACFLMSIIGFALSGCAPKESAAAGKVEVPVITTNSAEAAARSLVATLAALAEATRVHDHLTEKRLNEMVMSLADTNEIRELLEKNPSYMGAVGPDPIPGYVELWRGFVGYYIGDVDTDHPAVTPTSANRALVEFKARGKRGEPATIQFLCVRSADSWRIGRIQFDRPGAVIHAGILSTNRAAASAPASDPVGTRPTSP